MSHSATAQGQPTYKLVNLGTHTGGDLEESKAYGVNIHGEVVGESGIDIDGVITNHAFLWLPDGKYHLPQGMFDLAATGPNGPSVARDINDHGHVVLTREFMALLWAAAAFDSVPHQSLHVLDPCAQGSEAWKITNSPGPHQWVVGTTACGNPCQQGFVWKSEDDMIGVLLDPAPAPMGSGKTWAKSVAFSINPSGVSTSAIEVAGRSSECSSIDDCPVIAQGATAWPELSEIRLAVPQTTLSTAHDVNDAGEIVGSWKDPFGGAECAVHAVYWSGRLAGSVDIHEESEIDVTQSTFAEAVNVSSDVVGWNQDEVAALLWRVVDQEWVVTDLNNEISANCGFRLIEAHDINDEGWIVGWGDAVPGAVEKDRAFLLIPIEDIDCPEDVDRDGFVDDDDLALVINMSQTSPCPEGRICWADVNSDCVVNNADIKLVMRAYGPCGGIGTELTLQDIETWLAVGGEYELHEGTTTAADIAGSLDELTPAQRIIALYMLLGN